MTTRRLMGQSKSKMLNDVALNPKAGFSSQRVWRRMRRMDIAQELKKLLLREPRRTLAVAESITCGHLQARIGAISGASEFFLGGITAYTLDEKVKHLGVKRAAAKAVNSVSAEVA